MLDGTCSSRFKSLLHSIYIVHEVAHVQSCFEYLQPVLMHGVIFPQVQDLSLSLVELREISVFPFLQRTEVPLNGNIISYISILFFFYLEERLLWRIYVFLLRKI